MNALRLFLWCIARFVLGLRYRIRLHGVEQVRSLEGPILVLPNHPAYIDPAIVLTMMFRIFHPRPLLFEGNFKNPLLYPLMLVLDAIRVPDLEQTSTEARQRTAEAIENVKQALRDGQNVILWPSGRVQRTGVERLGAARTLSDVLRDVPSARIVLVRTRGLWGSRFSYAFTGRRPPFLKRLVQGLGLIFANLLFFAPRRRVDITLESMDRARLPGLDREVLNPFLEQWYNAGGPDQPVFVPAHFLFGPRTYEFPPLAEAEQVDLSQLKPETRQAVNEILGDKLGRALGESELKPETSLEQLGLDSLDRMELSLQVERRFGFQGDQVPANLGQLYALAAGLIHREPPRPPPPGWFRPVPDAPLEILGETVAEAFVNRALACRKDVVCADDRSGILTYEKLLVGALTLSRRFAPLPAPNVGLLLPASVGCDVALMALYLAGKVPVVLNWTTGPANLAHAAQTMNLTHVVTSKVFVDRLGVKVGDTSFLHLEELRGQVGKLEMLQALLRVRFLPGGIRSGLPRPDPDSPAVVLFTSGSEKAPKAVPLTHRNLFSDQRSCFDFLGVTRSHSMLGFLPAFHSFGLSVTGLVPLLTGMRVVRHPDPTDAAALARKIGAYKPTILVGTPTFASYILERAEPDELASLRLVVVGAEKCPEALFDRFRKAAPAAKVLEGYGITECSPVVSVNPPDAPRHGTVGKPLPVVETCVVDLDSDQTLPAGQMGMLLVGGPIVFPGYVGYDGPSPFREHDGKRWYVTGDLVEIDGDGYIHFRGRLKRFIKAGGEMISLPALEEPFTRKYPPTKDGPRVAVEGVEIDGGGRRIVLFSTEPITVREANDLLQREGFHGVMRLDEVRQVENLPVLGTGKTDYKVLRAQVQEK
jgi:long-chain-fatty-acid--[acyl-carrier-protein] ligase